MKQSESIVKLAEALASVQSNMPVVPMDKVNPFLKNKYASLGSVIKAVRPVLAKAGISFVQMPFSEGSTIGITTTLIHKSGEYIESSPLYIDIGNAKNKAQEAGSVITYLRRYSLTSALGIYADEDVDANDDSQKKPEPTRKGTPAPKRQEKPATVNSDALEINYPDWVMEVKNREGVQYHLLPTEKLSYMGNMLAKYKDPDEEKQLKKKAIAEILKLRQ